MSKKNNLIIYLVVLLIFILFFMIYYLHNQHEQQQIQSSVGIVEITNANPVVISSQTVGGISTKYLPEVVVDTYGPPLRNDLPPISVDFVQGYPRNSADERGAVPIPPIYVEGLCRDKIAVNIETRGIPREFTQIGLLKTNTNDNNRILSLFGRQLMTSGDKWQYYTLSNTGIMPARLPIYVMQNGRASMKDAMYEYGVDRLYSGDRAVVDGYDEEYIVQIYEPRQYRYIG
jgi:hypothetical protein